MEHIDSKPLAIPNAVSHRKPVTVLFACRQNAGRSQIAAALTKERGGCRVAVMSAGSSASDALHPETLIALKEIGLAPITKTPLQLKTEDVKAADWVITMGCGEECPVLPGKRYEDWEVKDPSGQPISVVREIRDDISERVDDLLERMLK